MCPNRAVERGYGKQILVLAWTDVRDSCTPGLTLGGRVATCEGRGILPRLDHGSLFHVTAWLVVAICSFLCAGLRAAWLVVASSFLSVPIRYGGIKAHATYDGHTTAKMRILLSLPDKYP